MDLSHFQDQSANTGVQDPADMQRALHETVTRLLVVKDEKQALEERLKEVNKEKKLLEENEVPTQMQNMGVSKVKLDNGVQYLTRKMCL